MRRLHPFAAGSVLAGLAVGGMAGTAVLNLRAIVMLALFMAAGAAIAALVCRRWPGLAAPAWKLWPTAVVTNPLFMVGVYWTIDQYECLLRRSRGGWDCLFSDFGWMLAALCLLPPAVLARS
ncbi:hypothetical protein [Reyranella sp.]|uniref:hypothetical protein n=1 Tax=Reyranella sp. TaxID=1929291 RepID=UPI003782EE32